MKDTFGIRLRDARQRRGWSQDELANSAGVEVATVRRAEGEGFDPEVSTARKLADALQVRLEWLQTGDEPMVCPSCQGRGFPWDYEDHDGIYAICQYCNA